MDDLVKAALAKWPHVPHCYGWLALDARGDWYMRDERVQGAGPFPRVKGSAIRHDKLREFIHRNYEHDDAGCWYFQNGPQRVYVELEAAPWVWRVGGDARAPTIESHTGRPARYRAALVDEAGRLFIDTDLGLGIVHTLDMAPAAEAIEAGTWRAEPCLGGELPMRYGYRLRPEPPAAC
jgi:hypothetical protein